MKTRTIDLCLAAIILLIILLVLYGCKDKADTPLPDETVCLHCEWDKSSVVPPPVMEFDTCMWASSAVYYIRDMKGMKYNCKQKP